MGQTRVFNLAMAKENFEFKPVKLRIKIEFVSHPARTLRLSKHTHIHTHTYTHTHIYILL